MPVKKVPAPFHDVTNTTFSKIGNYIDKLTPDLRENNILFKMETECSDIIREMKAANTYLFRGFKDKVPSQFAGTIRDQRKPLDASKYQTDLANYALSICNIPTNRSNSLFTSGSHHSARSYGKPYYIFPKNGFKFLWSLKHRDGIRWIRDQYADTIANINVGTKFQKMFNNQLAIDLKQDSKLRNAAEKFHKLLTQDPKIFKGMVTFGSYMQGFTTNKQRMKNLKDAIKQVYNLFDCATFIISLHRDIDDTDTSGWTNMPYLYTIARLDYTDENKAALKKLKPSLNILTEYLLKKLDVTFCNTIEKSPEYIGRSIRQAVIDANKTIDGFSVNEIRKRYPTKSECKKSLKTAQLSTKNLSLALDSGNEIMISNCQYYAFEVDDYKDTFDKYFGIQTNESH